MITAALPSSSAVRQMLGHPSSTPQPGADRVIWRHARELRFRYATMPQAVMLRTPCEVRRCTDVVPLGYLVDFTDDQAA